MNSALRFTVIINADSQLSASYWHLYAVRLLVEARCTSVGDNPSTNDSGTALILACSRGISSRRRLPYASASPVTARYTSRSSLLPAKWNLRLVCERARLESETHCSVCCPISSPSARPVESRDNQHSWSAAGKEIPSLIPYGAH